MSSDDDTRPEYDESLRIVKSSADQGGRVFSLVVVAGKVNLSHYALEVLRSAYEPGSEWLVRMEGLCISQLCRLGNGPM
jgi:hypothetical protein